jgi:hypothetical protein
MKKGLVTKFILAGSLIDKLMKLQGFSKDEELFNEIKELKNIEYIKLLKEALEAQKHIDREIKNLQNNSSKKK